MTGITRRAALARMAAVPAALAVGSVPQANASAKFAGASKDDPFGELIRQWKAAHQRIEDATTAIDCSKPTKAAEREWWRAMHQEDAAVAALLSYVPRNGAEERRKARFIRSRKRFTYEIQPEQWDYLLQAMLRARQ